ncbi:hypothetical protein RKLH11_3645 [Rhodobacteraceae bacterium KLH11]|nr:hypothetical protein RKLH11_3645 [Rhodobacteraceae bacterium KLH11]
MATRRAFLSLLKHRSTKLGREYSEWSTPLRIFRDLRIGIWVNTLRASIFLQMLSAS